MSAKTVLVVDDEKPLATALSLKLQKEGFSVLTAGNGKDCLTMIEKHDVSLVLLDLMLPEMNGFEVLEHLQTAKKFPPVIVLSNLSQEEDMARVKALGAKEYFVKSNTPIRDIVTYVKTLLHEQTG